MARESKLHYIAPSAISIIPNANGSANDLAVSVAKEAKIKVYCPGVGIGTVNADYQEWALSGRNRRLADSTKPYTIYARLTKTGEKKGYLIFAAKVQQGNEWIDRYASITATGGGMTEAYWYVRLGDVTLPEDGKRTVTIDTGILGTDQYNSEWELEPDELPLRIELGCTVNGEDVGATPYIYWGQALAIQARLVEGWDADANDRIDHWSIVRNTGNATADATWNGSADGRTMTNGQITLSHARGSGDDFGAAVAANFTITAWGADTDSDSSSSSSDAEIVALASITITVLAETVERYELVFSTPIVNYSPQSETYSPAEGVLLRIRATDQRGEVFYMTKAQVITAGLHVVFATEGVYQDDELAFNPGAADDVANATIPITVFYAEQNVELRLVNAANKELAIGTIAFVRDGEDSRVREWIYKLSATATYGTSPANIAEGEVAPGGVANGSDTNKNQEDWVPNGWTDEPQGVNENNQYEFAAYRDYVTDASASSSSSDDGGHWGDFSTPKVWSHYANDAIVYSIDTNIDSIRIASGAASASAELEAYFYQKVGKNQKVAAYIYYAICKVAANGTRTQLLLGRGDPSITYSVTVSAGEKIEIFVWESEFVNASSYTNYAAKKEILVIQDGQDGNNGYNGDTPITCYRWYKEGLIPTKPTSTISDTPDAVDYLNDNTQAQPTTIWNATAPNRPGDGWHLWMCQSVKHVSASDTITRDPWSNPIRITGDEGPAGETTVVVSLSPETVILSQATTPTEGVYGIDLSSAFTDVNVMKGNTVQSNFTVAVGTGTDAPVHCVAVVDSENNHRVKITGILRPNGVYYDNGYVIILVAYDGVTYKKRFNFYANLLGTWKETVIGDTKTEVAKSLSYGYDGTYTKTLENIGTYIKSSENNISQLQQDVGDENGGLIKAVSEISQTASEISLKVSQSVLSNLLPDPIFKNDLGFTGTSGTTHAAVVSQFDANSSQNIDDPWQGYGGRILQVNITSVTSTGLVWLTPALANRIKLEASKKYTFSVWAYVSDAAMLGNSKTLVEISMYNQATGGNRPPQLPTITMNDATGRTAGKFVQIAKTIEVASPYLYFTWLPLIAVVAGNPVNVQFAGAKLEVGDVATDMSFDYSSKASEAVNKLEQDLLDTGINISHKEILITSDNFRVQNNRGEESLYVNENGDVFIAGVLNNLAQSITASNFNEYKSNNYIDPTKIGTIIRLDDSLNGANFNLPYAYQGSNAIVLAGMEADTLRKITRLEKLRQCIGKKFIIYYDHIDLAHGVSLSCGTTNVPLLIQESEQRTLDTIHNQENVSTFYRQSQTNVNGGNFVILECCQGILGNYECIYWKFRYASSGMLVEKYNVDGTVTPSSVSSGKTISFTGKFGTFTEDIAPDGSFMLLNIPAGEYTVSIDNYTIEPSTLFLYDDINDLQIDIS